MYNNDTSVEVCDATKLGHGTTACHQKNIVADPIIS